MEDRQAQVRRRTCTFNRLLLASFLGGLVLGVLESEAFRLRVIYLEGPRRDVLEDVRSMLEGLGPMSTILCRSGVLTSQARQACRVADVKLRKQIPHTIYMHIEPRVPAAALSLPDRPESCLLADRNGFVYESVEKAPAGVIELRAFPIQSLKVGGPLEGLAAELYAQVMAGLEKGGVKIRCMDFSEPANIVAFLEDGTKAKIGGFDNLERKVALVGWICQGVKRKGLWPEYIDVRLPSQPVIMPRRTGTPSGKPADDEGDKTPARGPGTPPAQLEEQPGE
ncbi:MAG: cell division protein FtsQ/DivIB [Armatimonadota bacterium]